MTLEKALEKLPEILKKNLDKNLCVCNEVKKIAVIQAIVDGADSRDKVRVKTYASDGNGCCRLQVEDLLAALNANQNTDKPSSE